MLLCCLKIVSILCAILSCSHWFADAVPLAYHLHYSGWPVGLIIHSANSRPGTFTYGSYISIVSASREAPVSMIAGSGNRAMACEGAVT
jgi:hypothetical protein